MGSLEFEATGLMPDAVHECADGRRLWLYQVPFKVRHWWSTRTESAVQDIEVVIKTSTLVLGSGLPLIDLQ